MIYLLLSMCTVCCVVGLCRVEESYNELNNDNKVSVLQQAKLDFNKAKAETIHQMTADQIKLYKCQQVAAAFSLRSLLTFRNMLRKSSTQRGTFFNVFLPIENVRTILNLKIFYSPSYSKFAVECDLNSKISQICTKFVFFF